MCTTEQAHFPGGEDLAARRRLVWFLALVEKSSFQSSWLQLSPSPPGSHWQARLARTGVGDDAIGQNWTEARSEVAKAADNIILHGFACAQGRTSVSALDSRPSPPGSVVS